MQMVPKHSEESRRDFGMETSMRSYSVAVCSHVHLLLSDCGAKLRAFKGFLSIGEL